jgi:hypothetical protein
VREGFTMSSDSSHCVDIEEVLIILFVYPYLFETYIYIVGKLLEYMLFYLGFH